MDFLIPLIVVMKHFWTWLRYWLPLGDIKMMSSVAEAVGGGGYDCFPALAAAGIERAAGEGPSERPGRESKVGSAARWMDGWNRGRRRARSVHN